MGRKTNNTGRHTCAVLLCHAIALAAVASPRDTVTATSASFNVTPAADLQSRFNVKPGQFPHWIGSDCATSISLSDDLALWIFADTLVGTANESTGARSIDCMPHNSIGLMTAEGELEHRLRGECAGNVSQNGFFVPPNRSEFYWVETGAVDQDGVIKLLAPRYAFPCMIGCTPRGTDLVIITDTQSWSYVTKPLPGFDAAYEWPTALVDGRDGFLYILGRKEKKYAYLTRLTKSAFTAENFGALEFWCHGKLGYSWRSLPPTGIATLPLAPLFSEAPPETSIEFSAALGMWYVLDIPFGGSELRIRTAEQLTGPWSAATSLYKIPAPFSRWSDLGIFCYSPKSHPELATNESEIIISYMSNANTTVLEQTPGVYVPQLLRVRVDNRRRVSSRSKR